MMELYETHYGIYDHRTSSNPLASIQYNSCENYIDHYMLEAYLELFIYKEVNKHTGLDFDDFLDRPKYEIEKIIKAVEGYRKRDSNLTEAELKKLSALNAK